MRWVWGCGTILGAALLIAPMSVQACVAPAPTGSVDAQARAVMAQQDMAWTEASVVYVARVAGRTPLGEDERMDFAVDLEPVQALKGDLPTALAVPMNLMCTPQYFQLLSDAEIGDRMVVYLAEGEAGNFRRLREVTRLEAVTGRRARAALDAGTDRP